MKKVLFLAAFSFLSFTLSSQKLQISLGSYSGPALGNFAKKDFKDPTAGYAVFHSGINLEIKYYAKNLGIGIRGAFGSYVRDFEAYETDLKQNLGITDDNYDFTTSNTFFTASPQIGLSYRFKLAKKLYLEPYVFVGAKILATPLERGVYHIGGTTYTYEKKPQGYYGLNYVPGIRFQWNIWKHIGAAVFAEYEGSSLNTENETALVYSANSYTKTETSKSYNTNSISGGFSLLIYFFHDKEE